MRNLILVTASALALSTAGIAVAHGFGGRTIASASATFTATTANNLETVSCTGSDGDAYAATRASYSGTAVDSSDPSLNGPLTFDATSLINTTTNYGTVSGRIQVGSGDSETDAQFTGVYANGTVVGLAQGRDHSSSQLVANISAGFSATGGFTSGLVGGGTSPGYAVKLAQGQCTSTPSQQPDKVKAIGAVSAVSSTSITVAGVTCAVGTSQASLVSNVHVGDRVAIDCTVANGATTLDNLSTGGGHGDDNSQGGNSQRHGSDDDDNGNSNGTTSTTPSVGHFGHFKPATSKHPAPQRNQGKGKRPGRNRGAFLFLSE